MKLKIVVEVDVDTNQTDEKSVAQAVATAIQGRLWDMPNSPFPHIIAYGRDSAYAVSILSVQALTDQEYSVIVNGREKKIKSDNITFSDVLALAYDNPADRKDYLTVTYWHKNGRSGMMSLGGSIQTVDGMFFDAVDTSKA